MYFNSLVMLKLKITKNATNEKRFQVLFYYLRFPIGYDSTKIVYIY